MEACVACRCRPGLGAARRCPCAHPAADPAGCAVRVGERCGHNNHLFPACLIAGFPRRQRPYQSPGGCATFGFVLPFSPLQVAEPLGPQYYQYNASTADWELIPEDSLPLCPERAPGKGGASHTSSSSTRSPVPSPSMAPQQVKKPPTPSSPSKPPLPSPSPAQQAAAKQPTGQGQQEGFEEPPNPYNKPETEEELAAQEEVEAQKGQKPARRSPAPPTVEPVSKEAAAAAGARPVLCGEDGGASGARLWSRPAASILGEWRLREDIQDSQPSIQPASPLSPQGSPTYACRLET